ncbi:hypothetical protein [Streptomyces sp. Midd1]|uniref:hypothetical protein n=1 Tax=Streptomyces sp. Midd3 TaxID=3161191 RepID=UPI0034DACE3F
MAKTTATRKAAAKDTDTDAKDEAAAEPEAATDASEQPAPEAASDTTEQPAPEEDAADSTAPEEDPDGLPPGVYAYVYGIGCTYPHVPLTCHPHQPYVAATDTTPEIPEVEATVFEWTDGPPDDGRWVKSRRKPNQAADNAGPLSSKE